MTQEQIDEAAELAWATAALNDIGTTCTGCGELKVTDNGLCHDCCWATNPDEDEDEEDGDEDTVS